jgi:hypothetical protein
MSLITDEPLVLIIDMVSNAAREVWGIEIDWVIVESPEMEDADERKPLRLDSLPKELDTGRLSGKSALTIVIRSDGPRTRYGCTSAVSLSEVIDRAGRSFALVLEGRFVRKRVIIFSTWVLMPRGVETVSLLWNELD